MAVDKAADTTKEREKTAAIKKTREEIVMQALLDNKLAKLIEKIGEGEHENAEESVKALWSFLGERLYPRMSTVIRKAWNDMSIVVDEKLINENIDISDEALTLLILSEKRSELIEKTKIGKRNVRATKRNRSNDGESVSTEEHRGPKRINLVNKLADYVKHYDRIKKLREEDEELSLGWHKATCEEMSKMKETERQTKEVPMKAAVKAHPTEAKRMLKMLHSWVEQCQ